MVTAGHTQASRVDSASEKIAAPVSNGAGGDVQKKPVVRLLNSVRKSDIDTCTAEHTLLSGDVLRLNSVK